MIGRPALLTLERKTDIATAIASGNTMETAANSNGVSASTLYSWLSRGREEYERLTANPRSKVRKSEDLYLQFLETVTRARAIAEARLVALITVAAQDPKNWQAALALLERRNPEAWSLKNRTELSGPNGGPIEAKQVGVSDAELGVLLAQLLPVAIEPLVSPDVAA